ncbi:hypothetical protein HYPSUDRAFT_41192 [Hypholoma sublateritium FD-334 SS-4]|uniref:Uncharacterized protein n=1 Tax=Hypholoma sublateritium (strain FD-334 SS-4) TaxID=945553 RepID=A0A0D2MFH1_HYPSF|nr:hypothetical protein HYPSUDRAFT_41192 [Hypholoma sublateritium FD-334 SS-4]
MREARTMAVHSASRAGSPTVCAQLRLTTRVTHCRLVRDYIRSFNSLRLCMAIRMSLRAPLPSVPVSLGILSFVSGSIVQN